MREYKQMVIEWVDTEYCNLWDTQEYKNIMKNIYIVSKEELFENLKDVYEIIGSGCDIYIDKNQNKSSFIDFYTSEDSVGILTDNEIITERMYEKLSKLKSYIDQNKLKTF